MTAGNNPTDRSKLGTEGHILTDKGGIPLSAVISPASTHDINLKTDVVDNTVIRKKTTTTVTIIAFIHPTSFITSSIKKIIQEEDFTTSYK